MPPRLNQCQEVKSNGKIGLEPRPISSTFTKLLLMSESHIDHSSKLMLKMNGLVTLQPPEERSNGRDTTTPTPNISTGLLRQTNTKLDSHTLVELDFLNNNTVVTPQLIEVKNNGLFTITPRLTNTLTGTPTYLQEDHTMELPDLPKNNLFKPRLRKAQHGKSEVRSNGSDGLKLPLKLWMDKPRRQMLEFHINLLFNSKTNLPFNSEMMLPPQNTPSEEKSNGKPGPRT